MALSLQADDGYLYPLERAFFYVQKPPTLLVHDEIESVEFLRQGGPGMLAASAKTFDLSIRMQADQVCIAELFCAALHHQSNASVQTQAIIRTVMCGVKLLCNAAVLQADWL